MTEPPANPNGPPLPEPDNVARSEKAPAVPEDDLSFQLEGGDPPTAISTPKAPPLADDSPTIISRNARANSRPDPAITAALRGRKLAHFELHEAVGVGGMAAVLSAQDTQLDRRVALKILPPQLATDPESIRRFHQEARAAARLDHENIARVFYCGEDQGLHFIAFEFVEGENLRMLLDRRGPLPVSEAIHYMLQVATGLAHASARGVVHRDIKPSNIVITPTGRAKLVDMGLARSLGPSVDGDLTQSGVTLGTFDYISPEQALEPRDADVRSDIYSLGCTFYHILTGHAPVPEGTAAKKLHCHQHVLPVDPRHLNPAIADEVAAVLARMMAKDPKDRYQTPEHLVQHLLQVARRLGCAADLPEGMLFLDAPLPGPPRTRPVLVGAVAACVLVGLVVLLGALPGNTPPPEVKLPYPLPSRPATSTERERPPDDTVKKKGPDPREVPPPAPRWVTVRSVKELADQLKQRVAWVRLGSDLFDLKREEGSSDVPGLVFRGEELVIEPEDANRHPIVRLKHEPIGSIGQTWAALTVEGNRATASITGVRFIVDATGTATPMTALASRDGGSLTVKNCDFVQTGAAEEPDQRHLSALTVPLAAASNTPRPNLVLERCLFRSGDHAVTLLGGAQVQMVDCAFAPQLELFLLRGPRVRDTEVSLRHCAALLTGTSAVLHLDAGASCKLVVNHSLISCPEPEEGAVLVRQTGDKPGNDLRYEVEHRNIYHNLAAFWVQGSGGTSLVAASLDEFQTALGVAGIDRSLAFAVNPWQNDRPLNIVDTKPEQAFLVNLKLPDLRCDDNPKKKLLGIEQCLWASLYPAELPAVEDMKTEIQARKTKIVDPKARESSNGVYRSLSAAVLEANPGDEILIKHTGLLPVEPLRLEKASTDLTIRPYRNHKPILTLGSTTERDAALFRLHDGKLKLEDLEFLLQPSRAEFKAQSVVLLIGDGQCFFKNCLATLDPAKDVPLSLAAIFTDPNSVMTMDPQGTRSQLARIHLESCFVRGGGDLVTVRASRPFTLEAEDSLMALDGSLLVIDGNPKEVPLRPSSQIVLKQVTAHLGEHLVWLRREDGKPGLVPTQVMQAANCLFHSAKPNKTLVHLDGVETEEQMRKVFSWGDGRQNVYSGYLQMLDQQPGRDVTAPPAYDQEKWRTFTSRETEGRFLRVRFTGWPIPDCPLTRAWPANFQLKDADTVRAGAPIEKLRPPSGEGETPPALPEDE